jgi:hypothetical protein
VAPADEVDGSVQGHGFLVRLVAADHGVGDVVADGAQLLASRVAAGRPVVGTRETTSR